MGGEKLTLDNGKSTINKRGRKSFLDKRKMDGDMEGQAKITTMLGPGKSPLPPVKDQIN